jgi:hypothetical protein
MAETLPQPEKSQKMKCTQHCFGGKRRVDNLAATG